MTANVRTGEGTQVGTTGPLRRTVKVVNPLGLHHRVADRFSRAARMFAAAVAVTHGDNRADGKSVWDLMMLVVMPDAEVVLEVDGPDAAAALEALSDILASPGGEDYTI
ncbi:MAG TPA: HPr family phosphocarrier protein [Urbifossiella sp.]|nr:HPr family phosphocarrier protein [Urbifossiella sp.]